MRPNRTTTTALTLAAISLGTLLVSAGEQSTVAGAPSATIQPLRAHDGPPVALGAYLVRTMGCNDCHTPWTMGPKGPEPDMTRSLTGHPQDVVMPPPPPLPTGPWQWLGGATNTTFAGPWGVSFAANLTPDKETGLGDWTEEQFIATMRTGKHQGKGRALLPPMPYPIVGALADPEIKALWAYLRSLKPVRNRVPAPVDPPDAESR